jgi:hypothetical protein
MSSNKKSNLYEEVFPIWDKKAQTEQKLKVEIASKDHERLVLYFPDSDKLVELGKLSGGGFMPMGGRVCQVEDKIIAITLEEHSRGATLHNFEVHFLDFEGNILLTECFEPAPFLVRTSTHLFFLGYTKRYLDSTYHFPVLELHTFKISSLAHTIIPIEPPASLRSFYTREYISFVTTRWKISSNQVFITCNPWPNLAKNKDEIIPSLDFEYAF